MSNKVSKTVTDQELNAIMYIESAGKPNAAARTSSARGLFQFLKATWRDTVKRHRPDVFKKYTYEKLLEMRTSNPGFSIEMGARFTEDNRKAIGSGASLGDLYLAHFFGAGTAKAVFRADPTVSVERVASKEAVNANPSILRGKTCGDVRRWASSKMVSASNRAGDYVGKYYDGPFVIPTGLAAIEDAADPVKVDEEDERPGLAEGGDARLWDNQQQLKTMNYNPGGLDGVWGGGTAGAMTGFLNDRGRTDINAPTSWEEYQRDYESIDAEIDKAERERFRRYVTKERAEADPDTVERVAPEIVPAKRNLWTIIGGFFTALGSTIYKGFEWLMGYQDQAERFGIMGYIDRVPTWVWMGLGTAAVGVAVFFAIRTVKGIEKPVTTGERM